MSGPGIGTCLGSEYEEPGCAKYNIGLYAKLSASCSAKNGAEASSPEQRPRAQVTVHLGKSVFVEAFNDDIDEMWLVKTAGFNAFGDFVSC